MTFYPGVCTLPQPDCMALIPQHFHRPTCRLGMHVDTGRPRSACWAAEAAESISVKYIGSQRSIGSHGEIHRVRVVGLWAMRSIRDAPFLDAPAPKSMPAKAGLPPSFGRLRIGCNSCNYVDT